MVNFLLLLAFAAMLTEVAHPTVCERRISLMSIGWLCLAFLAVTFLNPNFNTSFTMTNQGDTSTMVVVGALGLMFLNLIDTVVQKQRVAKHKLLLQIVLVSTLLILIKQGNLALLGLLIIAFVVVGWKNNVLTEVSALALLVVVVPILLRYMWQYHVDTELGANGKVLNPVHAWRWDLLGPMLSAIGHEALRKSGCFGLILFAGIYGVANLFRTPDRTRDFAILAGIVGGGYVIFLVICYLGGAFNEGEAREAASIYRYATHVGLLNIALYGLQRHVCWAWLQDRTKIFSGFLE